MQATVISKSAGLPNTAELADAATPTAGRPETITRGYPVLGLPLNRRFGLRNASTVGATPHPTKLALRSGCAAVVSNLEGRHF